MPPETEPTNFGAEQIKAFVATHGWPVEYVPDVDSQYTVRPFLKPMVAEGVNVLGRLRTNRCFYPAVEQYNGAGRPVQLGAKFKLNSARNSSSTIRRRIRPLRFVQTRVVVLGGKQHTRQELQAQLHII